MRLSTLIMFGTGYVLGAKAGRERYAQIVAAAERASERLEDFSERHQPGTDNGTAGAGSRPRRRQAAR